MDVLLRLRQTKENLDDISRIVRESDSSVVLNTGDIYELARYLLPSNVSNFTAILDRNVYT